MDNGQNDIISKLLSDPKNLALVASVAKNFMNSSDNSANKATVAEQNSPEEDKIVAERSPTEDTVPDSSKLSTSHFTERENLLRSIKPYLKTERQPKVDSLLKALNIAKIISSYTDNNSQ